MTDKTIQFIIDLINNGQASDLVFMRPLSESVCLGRVWVDNDKGEVSTSSGYRMFFVKNRRRATVAAVIDMGPQDLHVFVHPRYRKKGHLVKALRLVILPYLFEQGREEQQITFKTEKAMRHAERVGFRVTSDGAAVIRQKDISMPQNLCLGTFAPSETQIERIKRRINMAADLLRMAKDDFETAFGEDDVWEGLEYLSNDVANEACRILDVWQDIKKNRDDGPTRPVDRSQ